MKFTISLAAVLTAAISSSALAAVIITPTPGQLLSSSEPFNLTFASQRIFKESSNKIDVVISLIGGDFPGTLPVRDMVSNGQDPVDGSAIYSVMVDPITLCCGGAAGNRTVYVLEDYNAFGGLPGMDMIAVPVTFV
ncbi:hypothetical protein FB451DRAFT_1286423 [Mycena latifolia]|nr:hypothetical protein FB451DRAFT_1286423 [Mycena latifolia]